MKSPIDLGLVKKHPVTTGLVVVGVGVLIFAVFGGFGSASAAGSTTQNGQAVSDPNALAVLQLQASLQDNQAQRGFQLAYLQQQQQGTQATDILSFTLQEDQLSAAKATASQQLDAQVALTKYTTDAATANNIANLNAQQAIAANNNATFLAQQQQLAQEQMFAIAAQSQLQGLISNNQTLVATTQIGANVQIAGIQADEQKYIAKQQADAQKHSSNNGLFGAILGGLFSFL